MTTRSQQIRQHQIAWRILDRLESLSFVKALFFLRLMRSSFMGGAVGAWLTGWRFDALLLLVVALIMQVIIFQWVLVDVLKDKAE